MDPEIVGLMAAQNDLVTRAQALRHGMHADQVRRLLRSGEWVAVRNGVYAEGAVVEAASRDYRTRRLLTDRAASLRISMPHVASHDFAALELGLPLLRPRHEFTHVTRPHVVGSHLKHGVKHHLAPFTQGDVVDVGGRRVLGAPRTALDIAREHGNPAGVGLVDAARARGATVAGLRTLLASMHCWPGSQVMAESIRLSDGGADSLLETLTRLLMCELRLGPVRSQFGLTDGGRTAWADLVVGRHVIECDGRVKYGRTDEFEPTRADADGAGSDVEAARDAVWREKTRQDWICGFKLGMSRVTWSDVWGPRRDETMVRLTRECRDTHARFGTDRSDLDEYCPRGPRPRPRLRT